MKEILLVLLGMGIWQLVVFITFLATEEDEEKTVFITMGLIGWLIYGMMFIIIKITGYHNKENQAKRIVKSAKKQLKKPNRNWSKWYNKYGKYPNSAWNIVRKDYTDLIQQMRKTGFKY